MTAACTCGQRDAERYPDATDRVVVPTAADCPVHNPPAAKRQEFLARLQIALREETSVKDAVERVDREMKDREQRAVHARPESSDTGRSSGHAPDGWSLVRVKREWVPDWLWRFFCIGNLATFTPWKEILTRRPSDAEA